MTAPTLPTTLTRLAELLPERVRIDDAPQASYAEVRVGGAWQYVYYIPDDPAGHAWASHGLGGMWLEAALREEVVARGWWWRVSRGRRETGKYSAYVWRGWAFEAPGFEAEADTPAHAHALALLAALAGGG